MSVRFIFRIIKGPLLVAFNDNFEARFDEFAGCGRSEGRSMLEWFRLAT